MGWMELVNDHRMFLVRLEPTLWSEIEGGTLRSVDLLRPRPTARRPAFQYGDVLLLYRPQGEAPDGPAAEMAHVVSVRSELSNFIGYTLGPLLQVVPSLTRERLFFASHQGTLPDLFRRADERTFTLALLSSDQRDRFVQFVVDAGIALQIVEGKGGPPVAGEVGETPGVVEFEW
jgi:hypothetical protein